MGAVGLGGLGEKAGGVVAVGCSFPERFLEAGQSSHGVVGFFDAAGAFRGLRGVSENIASKIVDEFFVEKTGDIGSSKTVERVVALDCLEASGIVGRDAAASREMFVAGGGREAASVNGFCGTTERVVDCVFNGCLCVDETGGRSDETCTVVMVQYFREEMAFGIEFGLFSSSVEKIVFRSVNEVFCLFLAFSSEGIVREQD